MFKNKIVFFMMLSFLITSCESIREGLTGSKNQSTDEFLVKKKDPLVLPPDFENLPNPTESQVSMEEMTSFEKTLKKQTISESSSTTENSVEESILNQIKKR